MGWLAPGFLLGALSIAVPVWLHLLKRNASQPRQFSSLMLFEPQQRLQAAKILKVLCRSDAPVLYIMGNDCNVGVLGLMIDRTRSHR